MYKYLTRKSKNKHICIEHSYVVLIYCLFKTISEELSMHSMHSHGSYHLVPKINII